MAAQWVPGLRLAPMEWDRFLLLSGLSLATLFMSAGVGYALGAGVGRVTLNRFLFLVIVCGLLFGPLVSLFVRSGNLRRREQLTSRLWHGDYLSSVVAAVCVNTQRPWAIRYHEVPEVVKTPLGPVGLPALTLMAYLAIGLVGFGVGGSRARRFEAGLPPLEVVSAGRRGPVERLV